MVRIGLISDTHGLLRPEAAAFLAGSHHILHAGDIGGQDILDRLAALASVTAVRGNNDRGPWAAALNEAETLTIGPFSIHIIHDLKDLQDDPVAAGHRVVVAGHSHRPGVEERQGVLYVNPGSAGPRRFKLPVSVGEILLDGPSVSARWVELQIGKE